MHLIRKASLALALLTAAGMAAPALAGGNPLMSSQATANSVC